jgi:hypothetical protein
MCMRTAHVHSISKLQKADCVHASVFNITGEFYQVNFMSLSRKFESSVIYFSFEKVVLTVDVMFILHSNDWYHAMKISVVFCVKSDIVQQTVQIYI